MITAHDAIPHNLSEVLAELQLATTAGNVLPLVMPSHDHGRPDSGRAFPPWRDIALERICVHHAMRC